MKKLLLFVVMLTACFESQAQFGNILNKAKQKLKDKTSAKIDQHLDNATDKVVNTADTIITGTGKPGNTNTPSTTTTTATAVTTATALNPAVAAGLKTYSNYDFIPGDTVLFEDHFTDDQDGEFPAHWDLKKGQAILNKKDNELALLLTDGNYCQVKPLMKKLSYLPGTFTVEYDMFANAGYPAHVYFYSDPAQTGEYFGIVADRTGSSYSKNNDTALDGKLPADISGENFENKWHHIAISYKKQQMKVYVDQYRVLVIPRVMLAPVNFDIEGIGDQGNPIILKNLRVAKGGGMNMLGKKFTDAKIVTHGINFDVDKATIKPESMGTLNMIVSVLKENPEVKFEIDGHTDNSGTAPHNLTLSKQRADAVKVQLVSMGIDAGRLSTKGYGDIKPISDNVSMEGKANNRRVEFVKI